MPKLFTRAFAESGDKQTPPDNDNSGFVSFVQGYTPDYERNLTKGDPLAKAVERPIQNALFNQITDHLVWYQTHGFMQWDATKAQTGYNLNDIVIDTTQVAEPYNWKVYRAAKNNVISKPSASASTSASPDWEEVPIPSASRALIPFQSGADAINTKNAATCFFNSGAISSLKKGFYIVPNATAVAAVTDKPVRIGSTAPIKPFTVEIAIWDTTEGQTATTYRVERIVTLDGDVFVKSYTNGAAGNWVQQVTPGLVSSGWLNFATAAGNGNGVLLSPSVPFVAKEGSHLHFQCPVASSGATDFTITIGGVVYTVVGRNNLRLCKDAVIANSWAEVVLINPTTFMLLTANRGQLQVPTAVADDAAPTWKQVKDLFAKALDFDAIFPVGIAFGFMNGTDPNATYPGTKWTKLAAGTSWRNAAEGQAAGSIIGGDSTTLTMANIPVHYHAFSAYTTSAGGGEFVTQAYDIGRKVATRAGAHSHPFSGNTTANGQHSHGASASTGGAHAHAYAGDDELPPVWGYQATQTDRYDADSDKNRWSNRYWTSTAGAHSHTITVNAAGNHQHTFSGITSVAGDHEHNVDIGSHEHKFALPNHQHQVSGTTGAAGNANPDPISNIPRSIILIGWYRTE